MTRILFILATTCMIFSCKKHHVEPAPQKAITDTTINFLPKMVVTDGYIYTFKYNINNLVETIVKTNTRYLPTTSDSTLFEYNNNNLVTKKTAYSKHLLNTKTDITYTSDNKIDQVTIVNSSGSERINYHYNSIGDVDYYLSYSDDSILADSTTINNDNTISYYKNGALPGETSIYDHYYTSLSGVFENSNPYSTETSPICSNLSINFQTEVAESFMQIGETSFPAKNYFNILSPRKYCLFWNDRTYTYTFDDHNRLVNIHGEFPNYAPSGAAIPGVFSYQVYY